MILSVHLIIGAAIANKIHNKFIAYPLAFLSHFVLDMIPHHDYDATGHFHGWKSLKFWLFILKVELDFAIGLWLILLIAGNQNNFTQILIGAFLGTLPDLLSGVAHRIRGFNFQRCIRGESIKIEVGNENTSSSLHKISSAYIRFHNEKIQNAFSKKKVHILMGIFNQIIVAVIGLLLL